jgi:hypothetical protein
MFFLSFLNLIERISFFLWIIKWIVVFKNIKIHINALYYMINKYIIFVNYLKIVKVFV